MVLATDYSTNVSSTPCSIRRATTSITSDSISPSLHLGRGTAPVELGRARISTRFGSYARPMPLDTVMNRRPATLASLPPLLWGTLSSLFGSSLELLCCGLVDPEDSTETVYCIQFPSAVSGSGMSSRQRVIDRAGGLPAESATLLDNYVRQGQLSHMTKRASSGSTVRTPPRRKLHPVTSLFLIYSPRLFAHGRLIEADSTTSLDCPPTHL